MSRASRDKGSRFERLVVNEVKALGIHAERVPLSGAAGGSFSGDVDLYVNGKDAPPWIAECKVRADGFKKIYDWLGENDLLVIKADRKEALAVVPLEAFCALAKPQGEAG